MPLYMYQASYTSESAANLLEEPQDRIKAVAKAFEGIKAEILVGGYPLGKYDVLVVYTAPDDATAAASWPRPLCSLARLSRVRATAARSSGSLVCHASLRRSLSASS